MSPKVERRRLILCGRCETRVGDVMVGDTLRLRRRDGWNVFIPDTPVAGEVPVWCDGCGYEGLIDVALMIRQASGRHPIRARLRRVTA